jgi:ABC-type anion transport system duplicated permease subunit
MSMSDGCFFVVASEAITVGDTTVKLPGIGSWLAGAIERQDIYATDVVRFEQRLCCDFQRLSLA